MPKTAAVCALCGLLGMAGGYAQDARAPQPRFRGGVELVQLDVTVLDGSGAPVRGLTAADFTVLEDGVARPIAAFTPIDIPDRITTGAAWLRDVASDVASNRADAQRVVVIVLDDFGVPLDPGVTKTAKQIADAVVDRLGPSDLCAVVYTVSRRNGQELTTDRTALRSAIERFMPSGLAPVSNSPFAASEPNRTSAASGPPLPSGACFKGECVPEALENAGRTLRDWTGVRKTVVLIGPGHTMSHEFLTGSPVQLRGILSAFAALQDANVTVYQFDPRGLEVARHPDEDIDLFSDATGGRAIHDTNTPSEMVPQVFRENSSYYLIAFPPAASHHDDRFRRIAVRVNRPDAHVRTRAGYFDRKPDTKAPRTADPLDRAIEGALPTGDLPIALTAVPFANASKKGGSVIVVAGLDTPTATSTADVVELEAAAFHDTWKPAGRVKQTVELSTASVGTDAPHADVGSRLDLPPGRYEIRLAARNRGTGLVGSAHTALTVPDYSTAPLELSGIVFERVRPSAAAGPVAAIVGGVPTTVRAFSRAERLTALVRVYEGTARKEPIRPVQMQTRIQTATGELAVDHAFVLEPSRFRDRAADSRMNVPLADLAPGDYLLSVEAAIGDRRAVREVRFTVAR